MSASIFSIVVRPSTTGIFPWTGEVHRNGRYICLDVAFTARGARRKAERLARRIAKGTSQYEVVV